MHWGFTEQGYPAEPQRRVAGQEKIPTRGGARGIGVCPAEKGRGRLRQREQLMQTLQVR